MLAGLLLAASSVSVLLRPAVPPRGWNSYDFGNGSNIYGTPDYDTLMDTLDGMVKYLQPYNYTYFVVDGGWYSDGSDGSMDGFGRPTPNTVTYPRMNKTWAPVSEKVHVKGLKFGLWMTLGIPNTAVTQNLPVLGTQYTASEIIVRNADGTPARACGWNPTVTRINTAHPGGMAYYKSVVALWAEWGVDYVILDCVFGPDLARDDLIAYSNLISESTHDFVLSLSPGGGITDEDMALAKQYSTTARVAVDLYANWHQAHAHYPMAAHFAPVSGSNQGFYINMDKLPFGKMRGQAEVEKGWPFWPPIQQSMLIQWAIVQSNFMYGGDLRLNTSQTCVGSKFPCGIDQYTVDILTRRGVLEMHDDIRDPRQVFKSNFTNFWVGGSTGVAGAKYVGIFNVLCGIPAMADPPCLDGDVDYDVTFASLGLTGTTYKVQNLWTYDTPTVMDYSFKATVGPLSGAAFRVTPLTPSELSRHKVRNPTYVPEVCTPKTKLGW